MGMASLPVILKGGVVSGESTGLGIRRPKTHFPVLLCDLERSAEPLWSQIPSLG